MSAFNKTQGITILTHQAVAHPGTVKGDIQDVSTKLSATLILSHASVEAAANTNPGTFHVRISASASGDEDWVTIQKFTAQVSTADTEALTATEPSGETVLACTSTTGFAAGDGLYIQDTEKVVNSEWRVCQEIVTNTSINLLDGLARRKESSDVVWNDAEIFHMQLDLSSVGRLSVFFQHEGASGANVHVKAMMITGDSIS